MSSENKLLVRTLTTGATVNPNRFVKIGSADLTVIQAAAATDEGVVGVSDDEKSSYASGDQVGVVMAGTARVEAGAAVTRGARVTSDSVGRAVDAATTNRAHGVALQAAGGAGEIIEVALGWAGYKV